MHAGVGTCSYTVYNTRKNNGLASIRLRATHHVLAGVLLCDKHEFAKFIYGQIVYGWLKGVSQAYIFISTASP